MGQIRLGEASAFGNTISPTTSGARHAFCSALGDPLRYERGKVSGAWVKIEVVGELARVIDEAVAEKIVCTTFVHRRNRKPFTRDGLVAMFRRHCAGSLTHVVNPLVEDFGLRDLCAKSATEMFRADPNGIRRIQLLLGHKSVRTTEIYLKGLVPETMRPNEQPVIAEAK